LQEAKKSPNSPQELFVVVFVVAESGATSGILEFAESASEKWRLREKFRELENPVGN
jgi:hypothetical protein